MASAHSVYELVMLLMMGVQLAANAGAHEDHTASVIVIGAGIAGITAGKRLSEKGIKDFIILEGESFIGGRMQKHKFAGVDVERGANWVEGVNGPHINPILTLAREAGLRMATSDYSNTSSNIYDVRGLLPAQTGADVFNLSDTIFDEDEDLGASLTSHRQKDVSILTAQRLFGSVPETPVEMALDYYNYDYEFAEPPRVTSLKNTEPLPTFEKFGPDSNFVSDQRGYGILVYNLAAKYLKTKDGKIIDARLNLNKVVREISYSSKGVTVKVEDGKVYKAKFAIITVSLGVLRSKLIDFKPDLPAKKLVALYQFDMAIYTKIFLKFPHKFWPTGPGTEFFLYADKRRGYYPIWQHLENEFPGSNMIFVTVTDDESRRIEQQPDSDTLTEIMGVLRTMFKTNVPRALDIYVPRWFEDRLFQGSFSNWPIGVDSQTFKQIQAPVKTLYFGGEHTSEHYNGYVHGAYFSERVFRHMI